MMGHLVGPIIVMMGLMTMMMRTRVMMMRMRITTRLAEVMPLDTKAAEVETNMEELIITVTHKNFSGSDLSRSKIVFAEQNHPYL